MGVKDPVENREYVARHRAVMKARAQVRRSFVTTTVRDESQVTPQGRH